MRVYRLSFRWRSHLRDLLLKFTCCFKITLSVSEPFQFWNLFLWKATTKTRKNWFLKIRSSFFKNDDEMISILHKLLTKFHQNRCCVCIPLSTSHLNVQLEITTYIKFIPSCRDSIYMILETVRQIHKIKMKEEVYIFSL